MRFLLTLATLACIAGCASTEYSKVPEPVGEWMPANPPGLTGETSPAPVYATRQRGWR